MPQLKMPSVPRCASCTCSAVVVAQGGEQDDEFALDEDEERGDRQRGRSRAGKLPGSKSKVKGEKDPW